jgi:uncharacterized protein YecE (DUF72 family)
VAPRPRGEIRSVLLNRIAVGTASWTDKTLIASKKFYPRGCNSPEDRLRYYATQFPLVEVDSSYYAMPSPQNSALWVERTPPDFTFNIKAFRLFRPPDRAIGTSQGRGRGARPNRKEERLLQGHAG